MEHLNMAQAAGIATLGQTGVGSQSLVVTEQLANKISHLSSLLSETVADLTMAGERLFGPMVSPAGANQKEAPPQGAVEKLLLMLDLAIIQANDASQRARGLNSRL